MFQLYSFIIAFVFLPHVQLLILNIRKFYFSGKKRKRNIDEDVSESNKKTEKLDNGVGKNLLTGDLEQLSSPSKKKMYWLKNGK